MFRMMHPVFLILVTLCCGFCCGNVAIQDDNQRPRAVPCPEEADISPCVCTVLDESTYEMEMECSLVTSNDELARIFSQNFPFKNFYSLVIISNFHLTGIRAGDLGEITFKNIFLWHGTISYVESDAFMHSYDTLTSLTVSYTHLVSFPFSEIVLFNHLTYLELQDNELEGIPALASSTVQRLYLDGNPISGINPSSMSSVSTIGLSYTSITDIMPGTFTGLPSLTDIDLHNNNLEVLEPGIINLQTLYNQVNLDSTSLTSIAEGALMGLQGILSVRDNLLTELAENVFRPLMDMGVEVYAEGNPLDCGCEIAWLVLNPLYKSQLKDATACVSGELVANLDPDIYGVLCK